MKPFVTQALIAVSFVLLWTAPLSADENAAARTGYFRITTTPADLLGEEGANAVRSLYAADKKLSWQLYVPKNYDPQRPAALIVYVSRHSGGGGRKAWNDVLTDNNVIWIGARDAGDELPMNERMLRAILAVTVAKNDYAIDPERLYIAGFVGGAHVASILATTKPEMFKGGLFMSGAAGWGDQPPQKLAAIRENRFYFTTGSNDIAKNKVQRIVELYKSAGIANTEMVVIPNMRQSMPGPSYLARALAFLTANEPTTNND